MKNEKDELKKYFFLRFQRECKNLGITDVNGYVLSITHEQKLEIARELVKYEQLLAKHDQIAKVECLAIA